MGKYIGHRLVARPEPDNTFWTDSTVPLPCTELSAAIPGRLQVTRNKGLTLLIPSGEGEEKQRASSKIGMCEERTSRKRIVMRRWVGMRIWSGVGRTISNPNVYRCPEKYDRVWGKKVPNLTDMFIKNFVLKSCYIYTVLQRKANALAGENKGRQKLQIGKAG